MEAKQRLIVALDVPDARTALRAVSLLKPEVGAFKIGLQLFTAEGAGLVRRLVDEGIRIFLDVKFHDIPNTVAKASVEVARLGVWMFNLHIAGGSRMMRAAAEEVGSFCDSRGMNRPKILGVTVLTSTDDETFAETGHGADVGETVLNFARLASECGMDGVVASPIDAAPVRNAVTRSDFLIVTPGIRPSGAEPGDQRRVMTPSEAVTSGSDLLVVGRPLLQAPDPVAAARKMVEQMNKALDVSSPSGNT